MAAACQWKSEKIRGDVFYSQVLFQWDRFINIQIE